MDDSGTALAKALEVAKQHARAEGRMDLASAGAPPIGALPKGVVDEQVVRTAGECCGGEHVGVGD